MKTGRPVLVMQLPTRLNLSEAREFLPEVMAVLRSDRPHIVFDFSEVQQIDSAGVEMLLKCLERVMSLDGDLKLAALTPQASVILELTRVDRLFEIFATVDAAVESFRGFTVHETPQAATAWYAQVHGNGRTISDRLAG
ncbi:MAG TPA: STAS domain-containing protein [Terriglobales bacterium]